jgi:hypothetical protein
MQPTIAYTQDVRGNTPASAWAISSTAGGASTSRSSSPTATRGPLELRYVNFSGAGRYNLLADRDYFATTVKYSF